MINPINREFAVRAYQRGYLLCNGAQESPTHEISYVAAALIGVGCASMALPDALSLAAFEKLLDDLKDTRFDAVKDHILEEFYSIGSRMDPPLQ